MRERDEEGARHRRPPYLRSEGPVKAPETAMTAPDTAQ